ncbi:MAG: nucleotidyltransferase family protein [Bacteroidales bacterium]|nr:nucleotidyltransferase family protein [Bacteroidales bacterium]
MSSAILNKLNVFFADQPIEKAWLFGSYARKEETSNSDVDLLVRFSPDAKITLFKYASMVNSLQNLLHSRVDLVEEGQIKPFAIDHVERDKKLIYERKH